MLPDFEKMGLTHFASRRKMDAKDLAKVSYVEVVKRDKS